MNMKTLTVICIASAVAAVATTFILKALGIEETVVAAGAAGGVIGGVIATIMNKKKDTE
jgi:copper(I)-binding protein